MTLISKLVPVCDLMMCNRTGPHWVGEYGCAASNVWRCPTETTVNAQPCRARGSIGGVHFRGCGCPGDPTGAPFVPEWSELESDQKRFNEWFAVQSRNGDTGVMQRLQAEARDAIVVAMNDAGCDPLMVEVETRAAQEFEPCGVFNCKKPKLKGLIFCDDCAEDYKRDPDAYK